MFRHALIAVLLVASAGFSGCGADFWAFATDHISGAGTTTLVVRWSDSPVDGAESVHVTLDRVEVIGSRGTTLLSDARRAYDLLALQNGVTAEIARAEVEIGPYDRIRLTLAPDGAMLHSITIDGRMHELRLADPSERQLELWHPMQLEEDEPTTVHVDFNVRMSVLEVGAQWLLAPRVSSLDPGDAGRLLGRVSTSIGPSLAGATVSAQQSGFEVLSTRTESDGTFELGPLPPGSYRLVYTASGHAPHARSAVTVFAGVDTRGHDASLAPVTPGDVTGSAPTGLPGLHVRVLDQHGLIDIAGVDPVTGTFETPRLPPGSYTFELWDDLGPIGTRPDVLVTPGGLTIVGF